jgi:Predicted solute binding protein
VTVTVTPDPIISTVFSTVSTTTTFTSTIATSSGFTPIVDTLPTASAAKRSLTDDDDDDCGIPLKYLEYPKEVICHEKIVIKTTTVSTVAGSPVTTTAAMSTKSATVTNTITTSSVILLSDVSSTLSYSTISTITETSSAPAETSTITATTTVTGAIATATTYRACAANNMATDPLSSDYGSFTGEYLWSIGLSTIPGFKTVVGDTASAYDCCVSFQKNLSCAVSFYEVISASTKYCYSITMTTCLPSSVYARVTINSAASSAYTLTFQRELWTGDRGSRFIVTSTNEIQYLRLVRKIYSPA